MNGFKSWIFSGGRCFVVASIWLFASLLQFINGTASSSVWTLLFALVFLVLGLTQKRRSGG